MNPNLSQRKDGWIFNPTNPPSQDTTPLPGSQQFAHIAPNNSLGLESQWGSHAPMNPPPMPAGHPNGAPTYYAAEPGTSRYMDALMRDTESAGGASLAVVTAQAQALPGATSEHSVAQPPTALLGFTRPPVGSFDYSIPPSVVPSVSPFPPTLGTQPSPVYSLRRITPSAPPATQPSRLESRRRLERRPVAAPLSPSNDAKEVHKRKRTRTGDPPGSSEDEYEDVAARKAQADQTRPTMLQAPPSASTSARSATRHLADPRPDDEHESSDEEMDQDDVGPMSVVDDAVVTSLYEEPSSGSAPDLHKLCELVNSLLKTQAQLAQNIRQIDARTRQYMDSQTNRSSQRNGTYVSPPEAPPVINWDQSINFDAPAGRQSRAARRVLLMGTIRETIFRLLSHRSVHDPLPAPPPVSLRVPRPLDFGIRWQESSKSVFNQMAAQIVAQKITYERPGVLTSEEAKELPSMVTRHIKYLCRCYKEQHRADADEFNAERLKRCSAGARKRQLFATRLQVIDKFPGHLGKHRRLIVHLGTDGTSSDEEDPNNSGTYKIKGKPQLSSRVTLLKRDLDHVYQLYFKGPGTKGSQVHRRVPSDLESTRPFLIQGLPLPCVARAWYQGLDPAEQEFYRFVPHDYDFSFPMSLFNLRSFPFAERSRDVSP